MFASASNTFKIVHVCMCMSVPPEAAHLSWEKRLPWLCCVALPCCLFDLACIFLPSFCHLSLKHVCTYRSHTFAIRERPDDLQGETIYNLNVRGKRGNIVQVYPGVEYDFVPNRLTIAVGDYLHIQ